MLKRPKLIIALAILFAVVMVTRGAVDVWTIWLTYGSPDSTQQLRSPEEPKALEGKPQVLITTTVALAQTRAAPTLLEGSWRRKIGIDGPAWTVDTYNAHGSVQTDLYFELRDGVTHLKNSTRQGRWRIANNALEVGRLNKAGEFKREGQPRKIRTDASGRVVAIEGWTRLATTQPTSRPSGGR